MIDPVRATDKSIEIDFKNMESNYGYSIVFNGKVCVVFKKDDSIEIVGL